jgi:hypothetical protein
VLPRGRDPAAGLPERVQQRVLDGDGRRPGTLSGHAAHAGVCEKVISGEIRPEWVETKKNVADIMTKPLGGGDFNRYRAMLGVSEV